jgi:signal transduction histidine kinase
MQLTFRSRLMAIVGIAFLAFVLLLVSRELIARRVEQRLTMIQARYLPKVELEPQLDAQLEAIRRGFQDAVSANDKDALAATADLKRRFLERLAAAESAIDPTDAAALRAALESYYSAAHDVSRRLIAGETGEQLVEAISAMQSKQSYTRQVLKRVAAVDRAALADAFATAAQAETTARRWLLWISMACLIPVLLLSLALSRAVLRSVSELTAGFQRFGTGDFAREIRVTSGDELGEIARQANAMAASLDELTRKHRDAEAALSVYNKELEAFSYSVAHDLRAPLRGINGFSRVLLEDYSEKLDDEARANLQRICAAAERMGELIDALLGLSRLARADLRREEVDLSQIALGIVKQLRESHPEREVEFQNESTVMANGDAALLRVVLENLLGNAWKFTAMTDGACVRFGTEEANGDTVYFVRDNGAGFDMAYAEKLFVPFQRLHTAREFPGTGIGLATVQRVIHRHGGRVWAESAPGKGATFLFTLGPQSEGFIPS